MTTWRKSSRSAYAGNCVEVAALPWRKASHCASGECVTVAASQGIIAVRDSKADEDGPVLPVSIEAWRKFTRRIKRDAQA